MKLKDLEPQLLALTPAEKLQAIQLLAHSLANIYSGIEKTPGVCGGDACIVGTRIPVWVLVNYGNLGVSDAELLKCYPSLRISDLENAWVYAEANTEEIKRAIQENEEA
ncbi:DUF433 domain-containing protein [Okeania sp. KiyG1]|uniref:DUF433 domain-containing protein n=1 Tax=Okeania sp. KiyG1 TaxID=2720165 RepID=UPI0019216FDA|nr:DUF433 domain-containing protein [Okeania sp. KiyG1]GGA28336.1 hypothetical protein CYANOKiyG1_44590 [Okeania sp. KiyG1]